MNADSDLIPFDQYLAAKKSVDDRALNRGVWERLAAELPARTTAGRPARILEIGAGTGAMIERILDWGLVEAAAITALDVDPANIEVARQRLKRRTNDRLALRLIAADLFDFLARPAASQQSWDLLIAHAFLDLVDLPSTLPRLTPLLKPGGLAYFTLNFDGATLFQPAIDPLLDEQIERLYHRTMDKRRVKGRPSGDSRTGRHLFGQLRQAGFDILAAGASDWVVFAGPEGYPAEEAIFLRFIIQTVKQALAGHPELDPDRFREWLTQRRRQIDSGELVYIAHQLDFLASPSEE